MTNDIKSAAESQIESAKAWLREPQEHWPEGIDRQWLDDQIAVGEAYEVEQAEAQLRITEVRRGWRVFKCNSSRCQFIWSEPAARHEAKELIRCPRCAVSLNAPVRSLPDPELKCDADGNLLNGGL